MRLRKVCAIHVIMFLFGMVIMGLIAYFRPDIIAEHGYTYLDAIIYGAAIWFMSWVIGFANA